MKLLLTPFQILNTWAAIAYLFKDLSSLQTYIYSLHHIVYTVSQVPCTDLIFKALIYNFQKKNPYKIL